MSKSHKALTNPQWDAKICVFITNKYRWVGTGTAPPKSRKNVPDIQQPYAVKQIKRVIACRDNNKPTREPTAFFGKPAPVSPSKIKPKVCTCGYHRMIKNKQNPKPPRPHPIAQLQKPPEVKVPHKFPQKPEARTSIMDLRNTKKIFPGKTARDFPLQAFAYTNGHCIRCGRKSIKQEAQAVNTSIKIVHTDKIPRFVQGVGLECNLCGATFQSYNYDYVITLPPSQKKELDAMIVGHGHGISMSLVRSLRIGVKASDVETMARANLYAEYGSWAQDYDTRCTLEADLGNTVDYENFPAFPDDLVVKGHMLNRAKIKDHLVEKIWLQREMAALISEHTLAIDHQLKVVKSMKNADGEINGQSFCVVGDGGVILSYVAVPDTSMKWAEPALKEVIERHGDNKPKYVYVDKDCCNGKLGGRTDDTKYLMGMIKKLDCMHLHLRISNEIPAEHPRKGAFMKKLSKAIYIDCPEDVKRMDEIRKNNPKKCANLDATKKKWDRKHIRRIIPDGGVACKSLLFLVKTMRAQDKIAKRLWEKSTGKPVPRNITAAHPAYPLITSRVWKSIRLQCNHLLNGCVSDEMDMYVTAGSENYRNTGEYLPVYISLRGTSKVETVHSVFAVASIQWHNIRSILFDAHTFWMVIN